MMASTTERVQLLFWDQLKWMANCGLVPLLRH